MTYICHAEAEYAYRRQIHTIPILAETKYQADGWLGALVGNKLYFDLSRADKFDSSFQGLLKELGPLGKPSKGELLQCCNNYKQQKHNNSLFH